MGGGSSLIQTPFCARVKKGRYFPDGEFMDATTLQSSSSIWRSVVAGRDALQTGLIKWVGDGSTLSIWNGRWIPRSSTLSRMVKLGGTTLEHVCER